MVMKRNAMRKNLRQSIVRSLGRYIAIVMIIALGSSLFIGLLMTKSDMVATGQVFMDQQNMFDLRLLNSYGWTDAHLDAISEQEGIEDVEPLCYLDLIARVGDSEEDLVYRFITMPETINRIALRGGRMPRNSNECLADGFHADDSILGRKITISDSNDEDSLEFVTERTLTIVGYVATPLYMDMNRGTTSVGSGSLSSFFYVMDGVLEMDYIPEIHVTLPGKHIIYSDAYNDTLDAASDALEPELQTLAQLRLEQVRQEAEEEYQDGLEEYRDGLEEYKEEKAKADKELADAHQELLDGEQELEDTAEMLSDAEEQIKDGRLLLAESEVALQEGRKTLASTKADAYQQIADSTMKLFQDVEKNNKALQEVDNAILEVDLALTEQDTSILQVQLELAAVDSQISQTETMIGILDTSIEATRTALEMLDAGSGTGSALPFSGLLAELMDQEDTEGETEDTQPTEPSDDKQTEREELEARLEEQLAQREEYQAELDALKQERQPIQAKLDESNASRKALEEQKAQLEAQKEALNENSEKIASGFVELAAAQMMMDQQFTAAEAQLEAGEAQITAGYAQLDLQEQKIADAWIQLEEGKQELADGWKEYEDGKAEAEAEFLDAWNQLMDGRQELLDARELIDGMNENDAIILDRSSNVGYNNLDSSSDIVQGVSRVFPVFFLLVASLVCITTMTRMIDEERTQIGTLKALGYTNREIIGKYLFYSGSGAVIGCGMGVLVGSTIFPMILWEAYKIMLFISPTITLTVNWPLCIAVVTVYTAVLLFVTWYCCRRALQEVPAELIRPKAPDAGKALLVEKLPFWHRISFLNKVTIRNIFRYRQRLAMMLVGIGGCTALLVTGFGLRDSIVNVVDYQFEEVTRYDLEVYFRDTVTEEDRADFLKELDAEAESMFYHQGSVELEFDNRMKEIYMICAGDELKSFIDLHSGNAPVSIPGMDEVVLSVGVAEAMGIDVGDTVTMRDSDLQVLELTVSGIYDNHVYNYSIVHPETIRNQWGAAPKRQMAFVKLQEGENVHELSAELSGLPYVMNVSVSVDMADMVKNMMDALDLVVVVIVFCAGLLAAIVLYNLTNININERIREIATIKVLGFNASETGAYVFKENLALTVAGSVFGLGLGYLLLVFVMTQIKIDMVWFKAMVMPASYGYAIALTLLAALAVDFIFYFKLQKINMAEALKSVE